jgi:hypothetical protein
MAMSGVSEVKGVFSLYVDLPDGIGVVDWMIVASTVSCGRILPSLLQFHSLNIFLGSSISWSTINLQ